MCGTTAKILNFDFKTRAEKGGRGRRKAMRRRAEKSDAEKGDEKPPCQNRTERNGTVRSGMGNMNNVLFLRTHIQSCEMWPEGVKDCFFEERYEEGYEGCGLGGWKGSGSEQNRTELNCRGVEEVYAVKGNFENFLFFTTSRGMFFFFFDRVLVWTIIKPTFFLLNSKVSHTHTHSRETWADMFFFGDFCCVLRVLNFRLAIQDRVAMQKEEEDEKLFKRINRVLRARFFRRRRGIALFTTAPASF